jgi:hypothetical protein
MGWPDEVAPRGRRAAQQIGASRWLRDLIDRIRRQDFACRCGDGLQDRRNLNRLRRRISSHHQGGGSSAQTGGMGHNGGPPAKIKSEIERGAVDTTHCTIDDGAHAGGLARRRRPRYSDGHGNAERGRHHDELAKSGQDNGHPRAHGAFRSAQKMSLAFKRTRSVLGRKWRKQ